FCASGFVLTVGCCGASEHCPWRRLAPAERGSVTRSSFAKPDIHEIKRNALKFGGCCGSTSASAPACAPGRALAAQIIQNMTFVIYTSFSECGSVVSFLCKDVSSVMF